MMAPSPTISQIDELVAEWCKNDLSQTFLRMDHEVIESTTTVRALIVERLLALPANPSLRARDNPRDLYNACGVLGRMFGVRGGSPTLVATTVDGVLKALKHLPGRGGESLAAASGGPAGWGAPARAALAEGYAAARQEAARAEMCWRWEYPTCTVPLHDGIIAIAAGYPEEDEDALSAWASRVAHAAALAGVRRAVIAGSAAAQAALEEALSVAGIERLPSYAPTPRQAKR
jgi:hypothetical protein